MNVLDAAHGIAHEYGVDLMAGRLGMRTKVLNSQVNPNDPTHVLGLMTAVRMQMLAERYDILYAMANSLDHVCIRKPSMPDEDLSQAMANACVEFGEFVNEVTKAIKDKRVTRTEAKRTQKELSDLIASATRLQAIMSAMAGR